MMSSDVGILVETMATHSPDGDIAQIKEEESVISVEQASNMATVSRW